MTTRVPCPACNGTELEVFGYLPATMTSPREAIDEYCRTCEDGTVTEEQEAEWYDNQPED